MLLLKVGLGIDMRFSKSHLAKLNSMGCERSKCLKKLVHSIGVTAEIKHSSHCGSSWCSQLSPRCSQFRNTIGILWSLGAKFSLMTYPLFISRLKATFKINLSNCHRIPLNLLLSSTFLWAQCLLSAPEICHYGFGRTILMEMWGNISKVRMYIYASETFP